MDRNITYFVLTVNAIAAIYFYIKTKCEIPLFLSLFHIFVEYRLISLKAGFGDWMDFEYVIPIKWNYDIAYKVSDFILIGTSILMYCFMFFFKPPAAKLNDSNKLFYAFIRSRKKTIIYGLILFASLSVLLRASHGEYGNMTKLGTTSFIIFFFLLIIADTTKKVDSKIFSILLFLGLAYLTYDTAMRFQFLSWMIAIGYYFVRNIPPSKKLIFSAAGLFLVLVVFSAAGVLRGDKKLGELTMGTLYKASVERLKAADDVNFIDGFMMLYQVYPDILPYDYGKEHLNILLRPIPRAIWPGKPLAVWVRDVEAKHGWKDENSAFFTPTLWGIFYAEGGFWGVIILSVIWAWFLAWLYRSFNYFNSDLSVFLTAIMLVSMIPVFRSGDLPGDSATVLMTFWPMFVFVYQYKKFVRKQLQYAKLAVDQDKKY